MNMRLVIFAIVSLVVPFGLVTTGCSKREPQRPMIVLQNIASEYSSDGAGGCIPEVVLIPEVEKVLRKPNIWKDLIENIDSSQPTNCTFEGENIPLGYICLDILLKSVHPDYWYVVSLDSGDDGLWSSVRETYYFPPDILQRSRGREKMESVQEAWQDLYEKADGKVWDTSKHPLMQ